MQSTAARDTLFWMPTEHIVALLIAERDKLNQAIEALSGPIKRRGRPPKNPLAVATTPHTPETAASAPPKKHGRTFTAAQRKAAGDRMRARWAVKKKAAAKAKKTASAA
jgi:hypothetical protein